MRLHGSLDMMDGGAINNARFGEVTKLPSDVPPGGIRFFNGQLWLCTRIESGLPVLIPCGMPISMVEYSPQAASIEWVIPHELHTARPVVQVYDTNNKRVEPGETISVYNQVTLQFNQPFMGTAVILRGPDYGALNPNWVVEQAMASNTVWTYNHGLGRNPQVWCIVDGELRQPANIEFPTLNQVVITWTTPIAGDLRLA